MTADDGTAPIRRAHVRRALVNTAAARWVLGYRLPPPQKSALLTLALYSDAQYTATVTVAELSAATGHPESFVSAALAALESDGLLMRGRRYVDDGRTVEVRYFLSHPAAPHMRRATAAQRQRSHAVVDDCAPAPRKPVNPMPDHLRSGGWRDATDQTDGAEDVPRP